MRILLGTLLRLKMIWEKNHFLIFMFIGAQIGLFLTVSRVTYQIIKLAWDAYICVAYDALVLYNT